MSNYQRFTNNEYSSDNALPINIDYLLIMNFPLTMPILDLDGFILTVPAS